ncbi:MAG: hypothetical protein SVP26_10715 [Chloroflexota bacterium]|nr:hypothetical protein [Chloroflexota bacterium]
MKKVLCLALAAIALVTSLGIGLTADSSVAYAQAPDADAAGMRLRGIGELTAQGDGIAVLAGTGVVDASGNGILWVRDLSGTATIEVTGYGQKEEFEDGWVQYAGFHGDAHIEGRRVVVVVAGIDIGLHAEGRGRVLLWGHGTYQINDKSGDWNSKFGTRMRLVGPNETAGVQAAPFAE